jgi:photosystem II stability/assembly factor-like uncharacterized protein
LFTQDFSSNTADPLTGAWRSATGSTGASNQSMLFSWQSVQTPLTVQILSIMFVDTTHGWLSHNDNGAMRTTDGGISWNVISFNDTNFNGAYNSTFFLNENTGWCTGSSIQIRKTTNGGVNWFKQYGPPAAGIAHSIYFFDANTGIIVGSKNFPYVPFVARSTNGGANWTEISASFSGAQELNDQYWLNSTTGWIAGYDVLLKTTDGGSTFTNFYANVPPTGNGHNDLLCVHFANQNTGWLGGSNLDKKNIFFTTNAGVNWTFQTNPVSVNNNYVQINDIYFFSPDSGWAIHGTPFSGAIMSTTNGGANWNVEEGSNNWFTCVSAIRGSKAWCGASAGKVWYSNLSTPVSVVSQNIGIPNEFRLNQNFPNPFNPSTKINFSIPLLRGVSAESGRGVSVRITVTDILGRAITTLVNEKLSPSTYSVEWDASAFPSGVYFYKLQAGDFSESKKMMLIK